MAESFDDLLSEARNQRREQQAAAQRAAAEHAEEVAAAAARARALLPEVDKALAALRAAMCPEAAGGGRPVHRVGKRREGCYGRRTLGGWHVDGVEIHTVHRLAPARTAAADDWTLYWRAPVAGAPTVLLPGNGRAPRGPNFRRSWWVDKDRGIRTRELSLPDFADAGRLRWLTLHHYPGNSWTLDCGDALGKLLREIAERLASRD